MLSSILPGLGQFYNRRIFAAAAVLLAVVALWFLPPVASVMGIRLLFILAPIDAFRFARRQEPLPENQTRVLTLALIAGLILRVADVVVVRTFIAQPFKIPTGAMAPTLQGIGKLPDGRTEVGDHILVDKLSYRFRSPQRGEIVVFRTDEIAGIPDASRGQFWVKRVVGLPGERVSLKPPYVCINGQPVTEPVIFAEIAERRNGHTGYVLPAGDFPPSRLRSEADSIQLGHDEYFVLGDNSPRSLDGRFWGPLSRRAIIGRVTKIYWPAERMGITFPD